MSFRLYTAKMINPNPNLFADNPLDRAHNARKNLDWCAEQALRTDSRWLVFDKGRPLIRIENDKATLLPLERAQLAPLSEIAEPILLGRLGEVPYFALDVTQEPPLFETLGCHMPLRDAAFTMSAQNCALAGQGMWLLDWHRRHRFCPRFGNKTILADGGFKRVNPKQGTEHFPRTDPVAIVLPVHGDYACLGRSPHFPEGMLSAFAGYLEACETLEECAVRELYEETGLKAQKLEYVFSQPWPFPSSLMVGYIADVDTKTLTLDADEIVEAHWFERDALRAMLMRHNDDGYFVPPPFAIAHQLLKVWLDR